MPPAKTLATPGGRGSVLRLRITRAGTPTARLCGRNRCGHHGTGPDAAPASDRHSIEHDGARANPAVVLDSDPLRGDALIHDRYVRIGEHVVHREHLGGRAEQDVVADDNPALPAHDAAFSEERPGAHLDAGMRHAAEIEHVQPAAVHDPRPGADPKPARATVQVDAVVDVDVAAERDVFGAAQPDVILDGRQSLCVEDQLVGDGPHADPDEARDPAEQRLQQLAEPVPPQRRRLSVHVEREP